MYGFIEKTSDLKEENAIYNEVVEAGKAGCMNCFLDSH